MVSLGFVCNHAMLHHLQKIIPSLASFFERVHYTSTSWHVHIWQSTLNNHCNVQRRGGRSSGDVQVLRLDDDGQGSRTEYMKVKTVDCCSKNNILRIQVGNSEIMALGPRGGGLQVRNNFLKERNSFLLQEFSLLLTLIMNTERKRQFPPSRVEFAVVVNN